ncbi:MAG: cobalamin-dependent protein, partial [Blastocatellia bacterium]
MAKNDRHTILLGGLGGDSHSVGLTILRHGLLARGYRVRYLGAQNRLEDFFHLAVMVDVVMISCMDGHSRHYLREFPQLMRQYKARRALWYLGGNLHIGDAVGYERQFMEMGFDRVFVKFVDIRTVLQTLERDLEGVKPLGNYPSLWKRLGRPLSHVAGPVSDERLEAATLEAGRSEALEAWRTGWRARDLAENAEFLYRRPSFPRAQESVGGSRRSILIQPRCGVPLLDQQIEIFRSLKRVGAPVLSYQVDSLTRNNNYIGAEEEIRESLRTRVPS